MVQKAVEMGASRLQPVLTRHGQVARVNLERMRANAIEAAEQCGILSLPEIAEPAALTRLLAGRDPARAIVFCDEDAEVANPLAALSAVPPHSPLAVLVGPEGGFAEDERAALLKLPNVVRLALGPRILRADTAAVAALAIVQAVVGDWADRRQMRRTTDDLCRRRAFNLLFSVGSALVVRLVDHPRLVDADEADVIAVVAMHAGDVRQPAASARNGPAPSADRRLRGPASRG